MNTEEKDLARHFMWLRLECPNMKQREQYALDFFSDVIAFPCHVMPSSIDYKRARYKMEHRMLTDEMIMNQVYPPLFLSDCDQAIAGTCGTYDIPPMMQEKESAMCYNCAPTTNAKSTVNVTAVTEQPKDKSLEFLLNRLRSIFYEKQSEISEHFNKLERPATLKELQEWLSKGNFHFNIPKKVDQEDLFFVEPQYDSFDEELNISSPWRYFGWGKKAPDQKARDAAQELLQTTWQSAVDTVSVMTSEETRLNVLNEFKATKFV